MVNVPEQPVDALERLTIQLASLIRRAWRAIARSIFAKLRTRSFITQSDVSEVPLEWTRVVEDTIVERVRDVYVAAAQGVSSTVPTIPAVPVSEDALETHLSEVRRRLRGVGDDVWQLAREQITAGVNAGESIPEIAARVQNVTGVSSGRANTIARTEVHAAHEAGAYQQALSLGLPATKTWLATHDDRTRETHRLADGQTVPLDESFTVGGSALRFPGDPRGAPSETINCVVGSTGIDALLIQMAMRSRYDGNVITIKTSAGETLTVTPNHPVLTCSRGGNIAWLPAHELKTGDYAVCGVVSRHVGKHNEQRRPTKVSEIFDLAQILPNTERKYSPADFHGERRVTEIRVVAEDRSLGLEVIPSPKEKLPEFILSSADGSSFGTRGADRCLVSLDVAGIRHQDFSCARTPGVIRATCKCSTFLDSTRSGEESISLSSPAKSDTVCAKHSSYCGTRDSEGLTQGIHTFTVGVSLDEIVDVTYDHFSGHVYNLSTTSGWYTGNTIILGNCRCSITYDLSLDTISRMSDEETSDGLVAAWDPSAHPRDKNGKFIKKGTSLYTALTTADEGVFSTAVLNMTPDEWHALSDGQKGDLINKALTVDTVKPTTFSQLALAKLQMLSAADQVSPTTPVAQAPGSPLSMTKELFFAKHPANTIIAETDDGESRITWDGGQYVITTKNNKGNWVVDQTMTPDEAFAEFGGNTYWVVPSVSTVVPTSVAPNIPAFKGAAPGTPAKVTTGLIWGKYGANTAILESSDGKTRIQWDGSKYLKQSKQPNGSWSTEQSWTKKDAYAALKNDTHWVVPSAYTSSDSTFAKPSATTAPSTTVTAPTPAVAPSTATTVSPIPAGMTGKPGDPAKFSTKVIWAKHANGQYVGVSPDGKKRIVWDENQKKYLEQEYDEDTGAWKTGNIWSKKDAYAALKNDTNWVVPGAAPKVDTATATATAVSPPSVTPDNVPTPSPAMGSSKVDDWGVLLGQSHSPDATVAVSSDGDYRVVQSKWSDFFHVETKLPDGSWAPITSTNGKFVPSKIKALSDEWYTPAIGTPNSSGSLSDQQVTDALAKLSGGGTLSDADLKAVAHSITQEQWNAANDGHLNAFVEEFAYLPSNTENDKLLKKLDEFAKIKKNLAATPTPTPAPISAPTPTPAPAASPTVDPNTAWGSYGWTYETKNYVENKAENGTLYPTDAVGYVKSMTIDDFSTLSDTQKINLEKALDGATVADAPAMSAKWNDFKKTIGPVAPAPGTPTSGSPPLSPPVVSPTPTVPGTDPTFVPMGEDVPLYVVGAMKSTLKSKNIGYWSSAEKIWDAVKEIQQKYPHPTAAGFSKYSPLNILTALDKTTTSGGGVAYSSKITKWATTPKGIAHIGTSGVMTSDIKPKIPASPSAGTPTPSAPTMPSGAPDIGSGDISNISQAQQDTIYADFKKKAGSYVTSPAKDIFENAKSIATQHGITTLQALRVVDAAGAKKFGVNNKFLFEDKIAKWLATPKGAAIALGQPVPKPSTPEFATGVDPDKQIPDLSASNAYTYDTISVTDAGTWYKAVTDKYGAWTSAQSAGLRAYTRSDVCNAINPYLWGDLDDISATNAKHMKNAQAAMRPSLKPVLLHRGCSFAGIGNAKSHDDVVKMVGQSWKADGFFSTSVGGAAAFGGQVRVEVEAPPGTPMAWAKPVSHYSSENEMLLAAGLTYHVISVKQVSGTTVMRVRVVPAVEV